MKLLLWQINCGAHDSASYLGGAFKVKYLGKITDNKDLITKEYCDGKVKTVSDVVSASATTTNKLITNNEVDTKINNAITNSIGASY